MHFVWLFRAGVQLVWLWGMSVSYELPRCCDFLKNLEFGFLEDVLACLLRIVVLWCYLHFSKKVVREVNQFSSPERLVVEMGEQGLSQNEIEGPVGW